MNCRKRLICRSIPFLSFRCFRYITVFHFGNALTKFNFMGFNVCAETRTSGSQFKQKTHTKPKLPVEGRKGQTNRKSISFLPKNIHLEINRRLGQPICHPFSSDHHDSPLPQFSTCVCAHDRVVGRRPQVKAENFLSDSFFVSNFLARVPLYWWRKTRSDDLFFDQFILVLICLIRKILFTHTRTV